MILDCSANPFDLSVPSLRILEDVKAARARSDAPIVVLAGERHNRAASVLLPVAFTKAAIEQGITPSFAIEYAYNIGDEVASAYQYAPKFKTAKLDEQDVLQGIIGLNIVQHVTHTKARFFMKQGIRPCFSDAAKGPMDSLDRTHRLTDRFVKAAGVSPSRGSMIFSSDRQGMYSRNQMMGGLALRHHAQDGGDILVHAVGGAHIAGQMKGLPYNESLKKLYSDAGYVVLSYLTARTTHDRLPVDAPMDNMTFIKGWENMDVLGARSNAERIEIIKMAKFSKGLLDFADITQAEETAGKARFINHIQSKGYRPK